LAPDWLILTIWFLAGIGGTGSFWYFLASGNKVGAIGSAIVTLVSVLVAIILQVRNERLRRTGSGSIKSRLLSFIWHYPLLGENEGSWAVKESAVLNGDLGTAREKPSLGVAIVTTELASIAFGEAAQARVDLCVAWALAHAERTAPYQMVDESRDWIHYEQLEPKPDFRHTLAFAVILARTRKQYEVLTSHLRLALKRQREDGGWPADSVRTISPVFTAFYGVELLHLAVSDPEIPAELRKEIPERRAKAIKWLMNNRDNDGLWPSGVFPDSEWDRSFATAWVLHRLVMTASVTVDGWHECLDGAALAMIQQTIDPKTWAGSSESQRYRVEARVGAAAARVVRIPGLSSRCLEACEVYLHSWEQRAKEWIKRLGMEGIDVGTASFLLYAMTSDKELAMLGSAILESDK
jgi:hypothetical protein